MNSLRLHICAGVNFRHAGQPAIPVHPDVPNFRVPQAQDVEIGTQQPGVLRRKPGRGPSTLSMSCRCVSNSERSCTVL